ncbi:MAG: DUF481 domain-containing protein [Planctomycetota bacterium]|jgi:putative salt-induced outer membrane protein YdiY
MSKSRLKIRFWCLALLVFLISSYARAETVTLVGGDAVHGEIIRQTESSIFLVHKVLGELEIPKDQVVSVTIVHDVLGEITISIDQISSPGAGKPEAESPKGKKPSGKDQLDKQIEDKKSREATGDEDTSSATAESEKVKTEKAPAADKKQAQTEDEEEEKGAWFEPEFKRFNLMAARLKKKKWSFAADFSIDSSTGNTEETTNRFGAHIKRVLPRERLSVDMTYYHKESEGSTTDNKFTAGAIHDWLNLGSRWFFFTAGRYDYDEFESWEQRANAQAGPGYNLFTSDDMLLDFRLGAGGRKEWGSENSDLKFEGLAGIDFKWKMTNRQNVEASAWYFPVITDFDDYRTRSTLNWRYRLAKESNISLLLGLLHEHQSIVNPGLEDTDTRVTAGLQIDF